ncbi:MAG: FtsQ-type POTRA domain-containing protein [Holosporaceae bacterium]|nr:FtsQ-type POTRA domain-containing protein [Holosporaceae bacterium]
MLRYVIFLLKNDLFLFVAFLGAIAGGVYFNWDKILKSKNDVFCIKKIEFDGNERVSDILLLKTSGLRYKSNILAPSLETVKKRLENIAWIRSAVVQRRLPDKIYVMVSERIPIAIFQLKHKLYLVDADGKILENDGIGNFSNLPIVIGEGAEKEAARFLDCIEKFPLLRKQLVFAIRIGKRRWNMKINKGITVKLPEKGVSNAMRILEEISDSSGFFNEDISTIDLRMLDRVIISKASREDVKSTSGNEKK